jgi:hypothetical protein
MGKRAAMREDTQLPTIVAKCGVLNTSFTSANAVV